MIGQQVGFRAYVALEIGDGSAMVAETTDFFCQFVVVRRNHSALARGDRLARMKTETARVTQCSNMPVSISCAKAASSILHNPKVMFLGNFSDRVHIRGEAKEVDGKNRFSPASNEVLNERRNNVERL